MKKIISIILCALLALPSFAIAFAAETQVSFSDVDANSMQGKAINILAAAGIVSGNGDGTFAPNRGVSRAELCKMVNNIYGYTQEDETGFSDVTPDRWYYSHVKIAKKAGYINGFEDGTFRGDSPVTREQACAIVVRVAGIYDLGIPVTIADPVSPWAEGYVKTIIANQLIPLEDGNRFRATEPMTRGELSVPLSNFVGSKGTTQPGGTSTGGGVSFGGGSSTGSNRPSSGGSGITGGSGTNSGSGSTSGSGTTGGSASGNTGDESSGTVTPPVDDTNKDNEADSSGSADGDTTTKPEETFDSAKQEKVKGDLNTAKTQLESIIFSSDAETASTIRNIITATIQSTLDDAEKGEWIYVEGYVESKYGDKITVARNTYNGMTLEAQGDFISQLEQGVDEDVRDYLLKIMFGIENPENHIK